MAPILPNELWVKVFEYLRYKYIQQVMLVCQQWRDLCYQSPTILRKYRLHIKPHNWDKIREALRRDRSLNIVSRYVNIFIYSIRFSERDLPVLRYLCKNVQDLIIHEALVISGGHHILILPYLRSLEIDNCTLESQYCIGLKAKKLKRLRVVMQNAYYSPNIVPLAQALGGMVDEFDVHQSFRDLMNMDLGSAFAAMTNLTVLELHESLKGNELDLVIRSLSGTQCPLKKLIIEAQRLTDPILDIILKTWSGTLEELALPECDLITNEGIRLLDSTKGNLRHLNLSQCPNITGLALVNGIATSSNNIMLHLDVSDITNITTDDLSVICKHLPNLLSLDITNCVNAISTQTLEDISNYLTRLETLTMSGCIMEENYSGPLPSISSLNRPTLRYLNLSLNEGICVEHIRLLVQNCPFLYEINVAACSAVWSDSILVICSSLKRLRSLNISYCVLLGQRSIDYIIKHAHKLEKLIFFKMNTHWNVQKLRRKLVKAKPFLEIYC